jgi:RNA polymerase sigma-70 factor, ECF subfamily
MAATETHQITLLLARIQHGDRQALSEVARLLHTELRRMAAASLHRQTPGHTWQPTDLVNELWVRLLMRDELRFENRAHFLGVAGHLMRGDGGGPCARSLARAARKRTPAEGPPPGNDEFGILLRLSDGQLAGLLALDAALDRLAEMSARQAQIVEMRFFAGLTVEETAQALALSPKTVKREWAAARAWLHAGLREPAP